MLKGSVFWAEKVPLFVSEVSVLDPHCCLLFSIECHPRYCIEQSGRVLPFGCHAWAKYDRVFWESHVLRA